MEQVTVQISALEHFGYCPRQCGLVAVEGQWLDNRHTAAGSVAHKRVDTAPARKERGVRVLRSIPLWHDELDLAGRSDVVELRGDEITPVEYKSGKRHGVTADIQLCAQALCLEWMFGQYVSSGVLWYSSTRRRTEIAFDQVLRDHTLETIAAVRSMLESGVIPEAAADARCDRCQLISRCLPGVVSMPERAERFHEELFLPDPEMAVP